MRTETACQMRCLLKRKWDSHTSLKEHPFVSSIIRMGRVLCKVTPAMPTWGLSPNGPRCVDKRFLGLSSETCLARNGRLYHGAF
jgi:hypothetical protein